MSGPADRTVFPAAFSALLAAPNPTFLCKIASARTSTKGHLAPVRVRPHPALGLEASPLLQAAGLAAHDEWRAFYGACNGIRFFVCSITGKCPLEIYRLKSVPARTRAMRKWFAINDLPPEIEPVEDPFSLRSALAIGGSPNFASYLAYVVEGPYSGAIFQVDHGGMPDGPLADSLAGLLTRAAADPVEFLQAAAAYPRYADGATAILWQPIAFSPNGEFPDAFETF